MPAVFIRLAGCNLKCSFCDTDFGIRYRLSETDIFNAVKSEGGFCKNVVITGGEPSRQELTKLLKTLKDYYVCAETNGTNNMLQYRIEGLIDWLTVSPKNPNIKLGCYVDELKIIVPHFNPFLYRDIIAKYKYVQPCDERDEEKNKKNVVYAMNYVKENPEWSLSLQIQKILKIR